MRELYVVDSESTTSSLVLRDDDGEEFFLPVDEELRGLLTGRADQLDDAPSSTSEPGTVSALGRPGSAGGPFADDEEAGSSAEGTGKPAGVTSLSAVSADHAGASSDSASGSGTDSDSDSDSDANSDDSAVEGASAHGDSAPDNAGGADNVAEANQEATSTASAVGNPNTNSAGRTLRSVPSAGQGTTGQATAEQGRAGQGPAGHGPAGTRQPRPLSDAMSMHPAEIQNRIRAGASAAELAEEMGVAESRVEAFAHPVMLERERIAQLAKQAHPVREDGPADLTLWEILATAFAARGHSLNEAEWTAYRQQGEPWIVRVSWTAGLSENEAEWILKQNHTSNATVEARNSVAADLVDPDFVQPVRSLTSVGRGARSSRYDEAIDGDRHGQSDSEIYDQEEDDTGTLRSINDTEDTRDDIPRVEDDSDPESGPHDADGADTDGEAGNDFLQHPDPKKKPSKRRRKAVTPHWEDVLLGVRTNTKRPRK